MKITFLSPANYKIPYKRQIGPTLGLAYMSSLIKNKLNIEDINIEVDIDKVIKEKPDIIGIPVYTEDYNRAISISKELKKHLNSPIIVGGPHITALPETLHESMDVGVIGEGENAMLELTELIINNGLTHNNLKNVSEIVYRSNNELIFTPKRILPELDELPLPDRNIMRTFLPEEKKHLLWEQGIYTSRGCPFKCIFCMYSKIKKSVRYHSVERVIQDIESIIRDFPEQKNIIIFDDLFVISKKRIKEIVDAIKSQGIHKKVSFGCMARASIFDDDICRLLREMNVRVISFGFETGSEKVLKYLKVDATSIKQNQKAIDLCSKYGINVGGYFIVGAPVETYEDLSETYWFIRKNIKDMPISGTFCISPVPGTKVWDYAFEKGLIGKTSDSWEKINYMDLIENQYLFLNENYSYDKFLSAYHQFQTIVDTPDKFPNIHKAQNSLSFYKESIVNEIRKFLPENKILEVGEHIPYLNIEDENIGFLNYFDLNNYSDNSNKYNCIFVNHILEKVKNPIKTLDLLFNILEKNGYLLILLFNSGTEEMLNNILKGWNIDFLQIRELDLQNIFTLSNFSKLLIDKGYKFEIISKYGNTKKKSENLEIISKFLNINKFVEEKDSFSYLIKVKMY